MRSDPPLPLRWLTPSARKHGLSDEQVPVLATRDRTGSTRAAVLTDHSADAIDAVELSEERGPTHSRIVAPLFHGLVQHWCNGLQVNQLNH